MKITNDAKKLYDSLPRVSWMTERNLARLIGVRARKIKFLKAELEAARLIDIRLYPNGRRSNPRHEITKLSPYNRSPICKHIRDAVCFSYWHLLDRLSLIECYLRSGWNIIPFESRGKKPVSGVSVSSWRRKSNEEKIDYFYTNPTVNIGLVNCHFTIVDVDSKHNLWSQHESFKNTLTVSTGRGFQYYFRNDSVVTTTAKVLPDVDTRCRDSFVVLPPSIHETGKQYEWINIQIPEPLPMEFRRAWQQGYFDSSNGIGRFILPEQILKGMRNDTLWRYGRSLKCKGKNFFEIDAELRRINQQCCVPQLDRTELDLLIDNVWNRENRPSFQKKSDS